MDRHLDPLLRHSPEDGSRADNGTSYLRRLKMQTMYDKIGVVKHTSASG